MANEFLDTNITGDVEIDGPLVLTGLLTAGTAPHVLTTAAGLLAGGKLDPGSVAFAALNTTDFPQGSRAPTITNVSANIATTSGQLQFFKRTKDWVSIRGRVDIVPTGTTVGDSVVILIDLPYAGRTTNARDLSVSGAAKGGLVPCQGQMDISTGQMAFFFRANGNDAHQFYYTGGYTPAT